MLQVRALLDGEFFVKGSDLQRNDASNPRFLPERTFLVRLTLRL